MTINDETPVLNRTDERKLVKKAKKIRKAVRQESDQVLLLTIAYDEEELNKETNQREVVEKTLDVFVPKLAAIQSQEYGRIIRTARKQGDEAAIDLMMETLLGEKVYEFILYELDNEIYEYVGEKLSDYMFGNLSRENSPAKN